MKKRGRQKPTKESLREQTIPLSIIAISSGSPEGIGHLLGSVSKIRKPFEKDFEILIVAPGAARVPDRIRESPGLLPYLEKGTIKLAGRPREAGTPSQIEAFKLADREYILVIEADALDKSFNLDEFFYLKPEQVKGQGITYARFRDQDTDDLSIHTWPVLLFRKDLVSYYLETGIGTDYRRDLKFLANKLRVATGEYTISQLSPFSKPAARKTSPFARIREYLMRSVKWNCTIPLRELSTKPHLRFGFLRHSSLYRLLFHFFSLVLLTVMPVLSYDAGISGDEEKHYRHARKVYDYYASGGEDQSALSDPEHKLNYYGQSFDLLTYVFNKAFSVENTYETRHVLIAAAGALTIIVCGFMAVFLAGFRAGLITMVLMFFSPRFLGHSFNNPLDIPFALGYAFTIYQVFRFLKGLPRFSAATAVWICLGIAFTISIRIGGLMLIPYAVAFAGLYVLAGKWDFKFLSAPYLRFVWKGLVWLAVISAGAYLLSLLVWPYGLQKPFKNPFEALRMMSNITVSIRVLFDGDIHWSNKLPWYYISKNIMYTVPVIVLAGFLLNGFLHKMYRRQFKPVYAFFLYFAVLFPVIYVIHKESNVYGGWRHLLFIFPPMAVLSAISYETLIVHARKKILKYALAALLLAGILHPARHIIANHPFEYIYFNELLGGVNAAYGRFETDYYLNSLKQGSEWLIGHVIRESPRQSPDKIRVTGNAGINYYFRDLSDRVTPVYSRYYDRGGDDWDYGVFFCNYISPDQLKNGLWPPYNTIHTIRVDTVPVCAVVKRGSKKDYQAIEMINQNNYADGIPLLEGAVAEEPLNEYALLRLSEAYINVQNYPRAIEMASRCLKLYPDYDKALNMIGISFLNMGEPDKAIATFLEIISINYRFVTAYHNIGLAYIRKNDVLSAKNYFLKAIEVNSNFKPSYLAVAEILKQQGLVEEANRYLQVANSL